MEQKDLNIYCHSPVAIVGMGCLFPKSSGVKAYWRLIFNGEDAISEVPRTHWSWEDFFDADPKKPDHVYCKRGGFISPFSFDPTEFGIPPSSLEATDTSQLLGLVVAKKAIEDAFDQTDNGFNRSRTSVILGVTGTQELVIPLGARLGHPIWRKALEDAEINPHKADQVIQKISDAYVSWQENSFPGLLGNVVAGRIANRLDLGGTNCVVDAACASSMSAVHLGILELLSGRSDTVITGGVDMLNDIFMHMCFSKTMVLSLTGDARPFSKDADGTILGEGIGLFVLKRLEDAQKEGRRIYAVIKGVGSSSDGKSQSIYAPRAGGQAKALQTAYDNAGIDPSTVELIEAHGTGTRVGDEVEFQALSDLFDKSDNRRPWCALGSVKSMIGHTKAAAGAAGLMKAVLSVYHKVLPPTLKVCEPDPKLNIHQSPFYLNTQTRPWFSKKEHPRRAGISAFGFGGSNFHVVIEEYQKQKPIISWDGSKEIVAFSALSQHQLKQDVQRFKSVASTFSSHEEIFLEAAKTRNDFSAKDPYRFLLVLDVSSDVAGFLANAVRTIKASPLQDAWQLENMFYGGPEPSGKMAFIFPGQGSQYINMGRDLVCLFPEAMTVLEQANTLFEGDIFLTDYIYPIPAQNKTEQRHQQETLRRTDIAQPAIGAVSMAMLKILQHFGLQSDAVCGHSYGELSALCAAGRIDLKSFLSLSMTRGRLMARAGQGNVQNNGGMLAVQAPLNDLESLINDANLKVILANRNSPVQGVLSGTLDALARAEEKCKALGYRTLRLPVSAAFHSSLVKEAQKPFSRAISPIDFQKSDIPVFSNTTGEPYPVEPENAKRLLADHLLSPVNFIKNIYQLYAMGVRTFVEVGPKSILTGLVKSILEDQHFTAVSLDSTMGKPSGIADLAKTLAFLASLGHNVDLCAWEPGVKEAKKQRMSILLSGTNYRNRESEAVGQKSEVGSRRSEVGGQRSENKKPEINTEKTEQTEPPKQPVIQPEPRKICFDNMQDIQNTMKTKHPQNNVMLDALQVLQDGLKSMQALQKQTAETHQKFLETQTLAAKTLQHMMENTQRLVEGSLGIQTERTTALDRIQEHKEDLSNIKTSSTSLIRTHADLQPSIGEKMVQTVSHEGIAPIPSDAPSEKAVFETQDTEPGANHSAPLDKDQNEIKNHLLSTVSQLTGYPIEMLALDMDIEADLGIDSIKRVEILSALEEKMPGLPAVSPEVMGTLKTLGQIVAYLAGTSTDPIPEFDPSVSKPIPNTLANQKSPASSLRQIYEFSPETLAADIGRKVVTAIKKPFVQTERLLLPDKRTVYVTDDKTGLSQAVVDAFTSRNIQAEILSDKRIARVISGKNPIINAAGLIILAKHPTNGEHLKQAFSLAKTFGPDLLDSAAKGGALFAAATRLDGAFGFKGRGIDHPLQGGLAGLVKTAAVEWENVRCRVFDIHPHSQNLAGIAETLASELLYADPSGPVEVGLDLDSRWILKLESIPFPQGNIHLDPKDVVIVTGGARGVTAAATCALAEHVKPTLVLLGRSLPPAPEPEWLAGIDDTAAVKKAIFDNEFGGNCSSPIQLEKIYNKVMAHREILKNLETMKSFGADVHYYSVDVRDADAVNSTLTDIRNTMGPIKGIIHGAGRLADCRIVDKSVEQFETVFSTKVDGLRTLLSATKKDPLNYLVLFSSVTARMGNIGQADYAVANEVLNKMAQKESIQRPDCRVISINWGPWDGGMVCSALKRKFENSGVELIPTDAGAMCMIHEMKGNKGSPVEVVIGANIHTEKQAAESKESAMEPALALNTKKTLSLTMQREIDVDRYPILGAHILDGKPVVPFALIAEWLGHGALHENPGLFLQGLDDIAKTDEMRK
ncbi:MAG: SDR family oxidoreductase [Desulfobacterales bacterium]